MYNDVVCATLSWVELSRRRDAKRRPLPFRTAPRFTLRRRRSAKTIGRWPLYAQPIPPASLGYNVVFVSDSCHQEILGNLANSFLSLLLFISRSLLHSIKHWTWNETRYNITDAGRTARRHSLTGSTDPACGHLQSPFIQSLQFKGSGLRSYRDRTTSNGRAYNSV